VAASGPVLALVMLLAMVLACLAEPLVDLLYGARWGGASAALAGLAVFGGIRVIFDVVVTFLIAVGRTTDVLVVQVVWLVAMVPTIAWGVDQFGLSGAGWAHVAVAVAVVLPAYLICLRRAGVDPSGFVTAWVRPVVCLVPAAIVCWWIGQQEAASLLLLAAGGLASIALYAVPMAPWWIRSIRLLRAPPSKPILDGS
jgi:PST family polysaccharide transporter